jgi:hypothetical protein
MAKLSKILEQEYKSKGVISGAASAVGKKTLEKLDIRNAVFGGSGIGSILGRKIFGKGYSASQASEKSPSVSTSPTSVMNDALLQQISTNTQITAKNTLSIPMMARDMNVMRQNIIKLVKLQGGTATNKADAFFSKSSEREAQYENMLNQRAQQAPSRVGDTKKETPKKSLLESLMGMGPLLIGAITSAITSVLGGIPKMIGNVFEGIKSALSIENIMKLMGVAKDTLSSILKFAAVVAANPVFLAIAGLGTAGAMLAKLREDVDADRTRFLELAKEKKASGTLSSEKEKELQSLKTPANQKASREQLGGYDPITNKIEDPNASLETISNLEKQARVTPAMAPGVAQQLLSAGVYDGYTKQQLESWSQGKNAQVQQLETSNPPTYNAAVDSQSANQPVSPTKQSSGYSAAVDSQAANVSPTSMSQQIGGAESLGNYNASFGDRRLKGGLFTDIAKTQTGKSLTDMTLKEVAEYQATRGANGAVGKYQFMRSTLFGSKSRPGLVQQEGLDINTTKFTAEIQEKLQKRLLEQNTTSLKKMNIPVTPGNQYMAHYIGTGGTKAVHEAIQKNPNMTVAEAMSAKGFSIGNNPELYDKRVGDFEALLAGRLAKQAANLNKNDNKQGEKLASSSQDVAGMLINKPETIVVNPPPAPAPQVSSIGGGTVTMASVMDDEFARRVLNYVGA